ncbi:MAG: phenol hydroxylase [Betaproteobacteria bacterium]|nr:phenol hydroxylase [Betaproteobacteria bacterium]
MTMDLRTITIQPLRQTFGHLARRMGADKPASRYMEGTMDLQPVENFHYRPTWDAEHDIFDPRLTRIVMKDWYALKDPRQFYYGAWVLARGRMQETAGADFDLADEQGLAAGYSAEGKQLVNKVLLPLRHVAWASNINNSFVSAYGYGIAIAQAAAYASMDQLGIAQYITRLAISFEEIDALNEAKTAWLNAPEWQGLRRWVEDQMVMQDWFELFVAQNFVLEGLLYPLVYEKFNAKLNAAYGPVVTMLTRFQREWYAENAKWVDTVLKAAAAESPENKAVLAEWVHNAKQRSIEALTPVAEIAFGADANSIMELLVGQINARAIKAGIGA